MTSRNGRTLYRAQVIGYILIDMFNIHNNNNNYYYYLLQFGCHPVTCIQNMKLVTNKFKSGGLHEKHVVATWNVGTV